MNLFALFAGGDAFLLVPIVLLFLVLWPLIFQWLWNATIPAVFNLPVITFWQAFRLLLLAGMIFGGSSLVRMNSNSNATTQTPPPAPASVAP